MRTLKFDVDGQLIRKNENCDFTGIVSNTKGYYEAAFTFSKEWEHLDKVAVFRTRTANKFVPLFNSKCEIPDVITEATTYWVSVCGVKGNTTLTTSEVPVLQKKGARNA